ncbi:hypothetical protein [Xenorhabdus sp. PB61.4]|nr:hypothetical protein [Xenorhabdus sp. PB61.4]
MSRWGNGYYFYQVCWALLVILLPLAFACFMDFLEDMTPNQ